MLCDDGLNTKFSQPTFTCHVCGTVEKRTGPNQKCCEKCRRERWLEYYRDYSRRRPQRGKRKLGELVPCLTCGISFPLRTSKNKFCPDCAPVKPIVRVALGQTFACSNCSAIVVKTARRQAYCADCFVLREKNILPAYKDHKNADYSRRYHSDPEFRARANARSLKSLNIKYANDSSFVVNVRMRVAIGASIVGLKQGRPWESLVGYTLADLMLHIERQFFPGMSWDNRDKWHIDHIIPLSFFKFETAEDPEFRAAWALTNLRPLWAEENLMKRAHRLHLL